MNKSTEPRINVVSSTTAAETRKLADLAVDPVLQVGSRVEVVDRGPLAWRNLLKGRDYTGMDIAHGENVDVVADLCAPFSEIDTKLGGRRFGFIISQHVLEHVVDPFQAARNLTSLTKPGGYCYVAVPWVQSYHGYPHDHWRFSFSGLKILFPDLSVEDMYWSSSGAGFDAAYKVLIDGKIDLNRTPLEIESKLFEISFNRDDSINLLKRQPDQPKLPMSRRYLPVIFVNLETSGNLSRGRIL